MIRLTSLLNEFWPFSKKQATTKEPQAKKKPGEVWKTDGGRFGGINKSYPNYPRYFDTEEKARRYATANIKKPTKQPDEPIKPADPNSLPQKALAAEKERRKAMFDKFKDRFDIKDDEAALQILHQLKQQQLANQSDDEPKDNDTDKDFKFGGGGGFSGGGGGSSF